jgi:hypothetical protein
MHEEIWGVIHFPPDAMVRKQVKKTRNEYKNRDFTLFIKR